MEKQKNIPELRFPEFNVESKYSTYKKYFFKDIFLFNTGKNIKQSEASPEFETPCIRYGELYYMYAEVIYNIINKTNLDKSELLFSDGDEILLPSAGEDPLDIGSASALTIEGVAIGRTINILKPKEDNIYSHRYVSYYINQKLRKKISTLAKGVSISNVYNSDLKKLVILLPSLSEQQKIASFLAEIDKKIIQLKQKKSLLEQYKNGVIQKIFSQEIRFIDDNGQVFPKWERKSLGEVLFEHLDKNDNDEYSEVFSVAKEKGVINQIEHLGRSFAAKTISHYKLIHNHDMVYTKSPTADFPFGIIKQNMTGRTGVVSPLYGVFKPETEALGFILHNYFLSWINTYNYLKPLVQKGAKNTMNINNHDFLNGTKLYLPVSEYEQNKIADFIKSLDNKINHAQAKIEKAELWKKGLLQKMFV
ncbi:MAG: restriction endonuclease subunit S [Candidatus Hodarchaeales archaeon]